jgi:hypothetical protein
MSLRNPVTRPGVDPVFREINGDYYENHAKYTHAVCGQTQIVRTVTTGLQRYSDVTVPAQT